MANQTISSIDFFKVLGLTNLSDEEKVAQITEISQEALEEILTTDLALVMSSEDLDKVNSLIESHKDEEAIGLIKSKFPEFDQALEANIREIEKEVIRSNFETRRDLLQFEWEQERLKEESDQNGEKQLAIQHKITAIEKILTAIDEENWVEVSLLCEPVNQIKS